MDNFGDNPYYGMPIAVDYASTQFADTALIHWGTGVILSGAIPMTLVPIFDNQAPKLRAVLSGKVDSSIPVVLSQLLVDDRQDGIVRLALPAGVARFDFNNAPARAHTGSRSTAIAGVVRDSCTIPGPQLVSKQKR
jgi:hypothetical protein